MNRQLQGTSPALAGLLAWSCAILLALTMLARAHASLNATSPIDGAVIDTVPAALSLTFSEPVSPLAIKLIPPDGKGTELADFVLRDRTIEISPPTNLLRGTHVLTWRVVSADGHPIAGSVVFSIGEPSAQAPATEEPVDWIVRLGLWLTKIALYVGLFIGAGGVFSRSVLMPGIRSGASAIWLALALGGAGATLGAGFQGLDALGATVSRIGDPIIWQTGFGTSFGNTVIAALVAFLLGAVALATSGIMAKVAAILSLLAAALAPALSGHASAANPQWLMRPSVFLHAIAIAIWIGALTPLGLALRRDEPAAIGALQRFSRAIPFVVAVLIAAGVVLTIVQVGSPAALFTTNYGQVFLIKLILLVGLFMMAAVNRWSLTRQVERRDGSSTRRLVRSITAETLVALAIFGAVAAWRFTPPPRVIAAAAAEPASIHIHTAKAMADLTITPGRAGPVNVSAVVMTGDFGPLDAKEVTFNFSNAGAGIEPFSRRATKPGDGIWRAEAVILPLPGTWTVGIDILINDFEMATIRGEIAVRP